MNGHLEKKSIQLTGDNLSEASLVFKALSSPVRLDILDYLVTRSGNVSEIAEALGLPHSTCADHIIILEEAGLISVQMTPGVRGSQKICGISFDHIDFNPFARQAPESRLRNKSYMLGIGDYFDAAIHGPCGLVGSAGYLGPEDDPSVFYRPERRDAQLLWFGHGFVEYRIPRSLLEGETIVDFKISLELCSEALGYNLDWPSDISVDLDGHRLGAFHALADYGGRPGKLNPAWWNPGSTQYGKLHTLRVSSEGCYIDEAKVSDLTSELFREQQDKAYIAFRLTVDEASENCGGLNLFGPGFGDYNQAILVDITCAS